ncbi:MAG: B12-binding domain-containing protein [Lautropia sp.]
MGRNRSEWTEPQNTLGDPPGLAGQAIGASCGAPCVPADAHAPASTREDVASYGARLAGSLQKQIIPRLLLANRALARERAPELAPQGISLPDFSALVLANDLDAIEAQVRTLCQRGETLETILLGLLAPTARYLGEMWKEDLCDFSQVTIGLWRLQQVVRNICNDVPVSSQPLRRRVGRKVLLLPVPGEQHIFGLQIVGELLVRAGWEVTLEPALSSDEVLRVLRTEHFTVIGMTASSRTRLEGLAALILRMRRVSRNRQVAVMVGGAVFTEHPELAALVGADATAVDGQQTVEQAQAIHQLASAVGPLHLSG